MQDFDVVFWIAGEMGPFDFAQGLCAILRSFDYAQDAQNPCRETIFLKRLDLSTISSNEPEAETLPFSSK